MSDHYPEIMKRVRALNAELTEMGIPVTISVSTSGDASLWPNERIDARIQELLAAYHTPIGLARRVAYQVRDDYQEKIEGLEAALALANKALDSMGESVEDRDFVIAKLQAQLSDQSGWEMLPDNVQLRLWHSASHRQGTCYIVTLKTVAGRLLPDGYAVFRRRATKEPQP